MNSGLLSQPRLRNRPWLIHLETAVLPFPLIERGSGNIEPPAVMNSPNYGEAYNYSKVWGYLGWIVTQFTASRAIQNTPHLSNRVLSN